MKYLIKAVLVTGLALFTGGVAFSQDKNAKDVEKMIQSKNFIFKAQFANPQGTRSMALTSSYDLTVRPDSVISFLPYFGRAYVAPINMSEGGIKFTSTDFNYTAESGKKGRWTVSIKPKDASEVQQLILTVYENGNASLNVTSTNRQNISFNGYVVEGRGVEKKAF